MSKPTFPITVKRGSVTVKIYRTPTRGFESFTVCHYQDGKRVRALFADLGEARTEAETIATRLGNVEADVLTLSSADRAAYLRARAILDPLGIAIEEAAIEVADAVKRLNGRRVPFGRLVDDYLRRHPVDMPPVKTPDVVKEFLELKAKDGLSAEYQRQLKMALDTFAEAFTGAIDQVRGTAIDEWLRKQDWAPRTRNNMRNSLQTLFNFAKARRYLARDHDELEAVMVARDGDGDIEIFTPAELSELLAHTPENLIPFVTLGAFAGVRHAEIQRLDWKDIQLEHDLIEIRAAKAKTASRRMIPITPNLKAWLNTIEDREGLVCEVQNVSNALQEVVAAINRARKEQRARSEEQGAKGRTKKKGKHSTSNIQHLTSNEGGDDWKFKWKRNGLRHSFISYRVAAVQNVAQVALEAGNSPQMIFKHYRELVRPADAEKWFAIAPMAREG